MTPKNPETAKLANNAFVESGCQTHAEFVALFGDAVPLRTFRGWLAGEQALPRIAALMLREFIAGWRPTCLE